MRTRLLSLFILLTTSLYAQPTVPQWAKDAVWYQIFPERFRNGNTKNDPTREELELLAESAPQSIEDLSQLPMLKRWQREVFGAELLDVLKS